MSTILWVVTGFIALTTAARFFDRTKNLQPFKYLNGLASKYGSDISMVISVMACVMMYIWIFDENRESVLIPLLIWAILHMNWVQDEIKQDIKSIKNEIKKRSETGD